MALSLIAALDAAGTIGHGNALPWRLPDDLRRFKALTLGKPILMGGNTARSLGRALPGRLNLVLTRAPAAPFEGMQPVATLDQAIALAGPGELMVIGGGEIYALTLARATRLYLTHVLTTVPAADAFFPAFDAADWIVTARQRHEADAHHAHAFEFVDYRRKASSVA